MQKGVGKGGAQKIIWDFISDAELKKMYEKDKLSLTRIAEKLGVTIKPLSNKLKSIGVHVHFSGEHKFLENLQNYPDLLNEKETITAEKFKCSLSTIRVAKRIKREERNYGHLE